MSLNIEMRQDRVLVLPTEQEDTSAGGIILTQKGDDKPMTGEIKAMGPGKKDVSMEGLKLGNTIVFGQYAGTKLKLDGVEYLIVREDDILAVLS